MIKPTKRIPKSKAQLVNEVKDNQRVNKQKQLLRAIFTKTNKDITIEDFTNHVNVFAGLILEAQKKLTNEMTIASLKVDLKVKDAPHPELIAQLHELFKNEKAPEEVSALLAKFVDHIKYQIKEVAFIERKVSDIGVEEMLK